MKGGIIITVEELEIIVTAKVEEAVREVMKLVPQIKQAMKQAQEAFEKVDTKKMQSKFQQAVQFMKKKIQGYTGDCCGATFLLCELSFYLGIAVIYTTTL